MDLGLHGARVLVTGASKGIGLACAETFLAEGAEVVIVARDAARLDMAAQALRDRFGERVSAIAADLSRADERERVLGEAGALDILVNNAGAIPGGSVFDIDLATWEAAWSLKVMGYIHLTGMALAAMRERGAGVIVNVIGQGGRRPRWSYACGAAGNAALMAFTEAVGAGSAAFGVRVLGVNPTATRTDRVASVYRQRALTQFGDPGRWEEVLGDLPFGRLCEPGEIASMVAVLASPRASYVSGTVVDVDGGKSNTG